MGFSLSRALAGAIVGGATATAQVADNEIKFAEKRREEEAQMERQRALLVQQDELLGNRAERVAKTKQALEDAKRDKEATIYKDAIADIKSRGIVPGSPEGFIALAEAAAKGGAPTMADKFYDDANKVRQIASHESIAKAQIAGNLEIQRMNRQLRTDDKAAAISAKEEAAIFTRLNQLSKVTQFNKDGSHAPVDVSGIINDGFQQMIGEGKFTKADALKALSKINTGMAVAASKGGDPFVVGTGLLDDVAKANWAKPVAPPKPGAGSAPGELSPAKKALIAKINADGSAAPASAPSVTPRIAPPPVATTLLGEPSSRYAAWERANGEAYRAQQDADAAAARDATAGADLSQYEAMQ